MYGAAPGFRRRGPYSPAPAQAVVAPLVTPAVPAAPLVIVNEPTPYSPAALDEIRAAFKGGDMRPRVLRFTPEQWDQTFPAHAIQRKIEKRLANRKTELRHLEAFKPQMVQVSAVYNLWNDTFTKLGGHTRPYLQKHGLVDYHIPYYDAVFYFAATYEAGNDLYRIENSTAAGDIARNKLESALQEAGLPDPTQSPCLMEGKFTSALQYAYCLVKQARFNPGDLKGYWQQDKATLTTQLKTLEYAFYAADDLALPRVKAYLVAAVLFTIHLFKDDAIEFWSLYFEGEYGRKEGKSRNAISYVEMAVQDCEGQKVINQITTFMPKAVAAIVQYRMDPITRAVLDDDGEVVTEAHYGRMVQKWHPASDESVDGHKARA